MASQSRRPKLHLLEGEQYKLDQLRNSKTAAARDVFRAQIMSRYHAGETVSEIARALKTTRASVLKWVDKALQMGVEAGLKDTPHKPREASITDDAKAWVVSLACSKPKEFGYAAELWTRSALARHVRANAKQEGFPALSQAAKATVHRILAMQELQPHKVRYYLERRDPEFKPKMKTVLTVYQEVSLYLDAIEREAQEGKPAPPPSIITVAVDEKPGVQAIANTASDLPPVPGKHPTVSRDHEYKRLGTLSILASLDLLDGHVIARVEPRHRSVEFVSLLRELDSYYPPEHPNRPGQPLRPSLQRDPPVSGRTPQPIQVRSHSHAWIVVEHRRNTVWQDGENLSQTHPRRLRPGVEGSNPRGNR